MIIVSIPVSYYGVFTDGKDRLARRPVYLPDNNLNLD